VRRLRPTRRSLLSSLVPRPSPLVPRPSSLAPRPSPLVPHLVGNSDCSVGRRTGLARGGGAARGGSRTRVLDGAGFVAAGVRVASTTRIVIVREGEGAEVGGGTSIGGGFSSPRTSPQSTGAADAAPPTAARSRRGSRVARQIRKSLIGQIARDLAIDMRTGALPLPWLQPPVHWSKAGGGAVQFRTNALQWRPLPTLRERRAKSLAQFPLVCG
jgi:hypothetical protein